MLTPSLPLKLRALTVEQVLERAVLAAVVLAGVVAISPNVADPDLWGHVQYGRDYLRGGLPATTTYSYLAHDQEWINHENLMELALALGADYLGPVGMIVAKMLGGLGVLLLVLHFCRRQGAGLIASALIVLLTAASVAHYWALRPQLFSIAAYAAMLSLLQWCFAGWEGSWWLGGAKGRGQREEGEGASTAHVSPACLISTRPFHLRISWLWLVPLLMMAWTNAHGGFLAGCAVFGVYLAMRSCEAFWQVGWRAVGTIKRFGVWVTATLLATFLNPYGYEFHLWLLNDLGVPRPEITEWLPPNFASAEMFPLLLLIGVFVTCLAFSRRSWDATHLVILVATLWQSLAHQRHIPFFALSVAFFLPRHVEDVIARVRRQGAGVRGQETGVGGQRGTAAIALGMCAAFGLLGWKLYERGSDLKVRRDWFPVSAVQFVANHELRGRIVCTFNWAQYVLSAFASPNSPPQLLVHVDGRCRTAYSQAMLDEHFDFLFGEQPASVRYRAPGSPFDPLKALEHGQPNLVLIDRGQPHSVQVMQSQRERWVLLYQDGLAQLWGRRERYDDPQSLDFLPPHERRISDESQQGHVTWPALPVVHHES
jgi:hypothetical protein